MRYKTMGEKIRELRQQKGYSQEYVAKAAGISQPAYSRYESDLVTRFIPQHIKSIAETLNTTAEYLTQTQDRLAHLPEEVQNWLESEKSVPYLKEAYIKYINEK